MMFDCSTGHEGSDSVVGRMGGCLIAISLGR